MARNSGARRLVERNIYIDDSGYEIQMMVRRQRDHRRMPPGSTITQLREARAAMHARLLAQASKRAAGVGHPGTMRGDADRFLAGWTGVHKDHVRRRISLWVEALGPRTKRAHITADSIGAVLAGWSSEQQAHTSQQRPYAPETLRKQLRVLRQMWRTLDGRHAFNPAMDVPLPKVSKPLARAMHLDDAERILASMQASATRARLTLMLRLGITPCEIMRMQASHVDWRAGRVTILARRKGAGSHPRALPFGLFDDAVAAMQEYASFNVWAQTFHVSAMRASFQAAAAKCGVPGVRPYDLRHTCGTEIYRRTGNIRAAQKWLGHENPATTARYILGGDDDHLMAAARAMNASSQARKAAAQQEPQQTAAA